MLYLARYYTQYNTYALWYWSDGCNYWVNNPGKI